MSLVSASGLVSGIKEYIYRGIQELPTVLSLTFFLFAITTGSIAHSTLFVGISIFMPLFTMLTKGMMGKIIECMFHGNNEELRKKLWTCSGSDVCNTVSSYKKMATPDYFINNTNGSSAPSYWITTMGFFFGFVFSNIMDTMNSPMYPGSDPVGHEKRNSQSMFILCATSLFLIGLVIIRFYLMGACEGQGFLGKSISIAFGIISGIIGWGFYEISKSCGSRSSDLFGVLSQIIPPSASAVSPTVCVSE